MTAADPVTELAPAGVVTTAFLRRTGLLWKINHDILHPLGLSLGVNVAIDEATGEPVDNDTDPAALGVFIAPAPPFQYSPGDNAAGAAKWDEFTGRIADIARQAAIPGPDGRPPRTHG